MFCVRGSSLVDLPLSLSFRRVRWFGFVDLLLRHERHRIYSIDNECNWTISSWRSSDLRCCRSIDQRWITEEEIVFDSYLCRHRKYDEDWSSLSTRRIEWRLSLRTRHSRFLSRTFDSVVVDERSGRTNSFVEQSFVFGWFSSWWHRCSTRDDRVRCGHSLHRSTWSSSRDTQFFIQIENNHDWMIFSMSWIFFRVLLIFWLTLCVTWRIGSWTCSIFFFPCWTFRFFFVLKAWRNSPWPSIDAKKTNTSRATTTNQREKCIFNEWSHFSFSFSRSTTTKIRESDQINPEAMIRFL